MIALTAGMAVSNARSSTGDGTLKASSSARGLTHKGRGGRRRRVFSRSRAPVLRATSRCATVPPVEEALAGHLLKAIASGKSEPLSLELKSSR